MPGGAHEDDDAARVEAVTAALEAARSGDQAALGALFTAVYDDLRQLARAQRRRWSGNETLDTTALLHESYLRLVDRSRFGWEDLGHFVAVACRAMRHILIDYARGQKADKRGGEAVRVALGDASGADDPSDPETLLALCRGLERLAVRAPRRRLERGGGGRPGRPRDHRERARRVPRLARAARPGAADAGRPVRAAPPPRRLRRLHPVARHGELGDLDRALEAARRSLELRREILGDAHRVTGMTWGRLAHALFDAGRDQEAASAAERSREVTREADPVSYANVGLLLARVQSRAGLLAPAVATARESLAIYQRRFGAEHAMTLRGHAAVTQALSAAGQQVAAIQSQERAVAIGEATLRPEHPRRSELRLALGELLLRAGRRQRAATALREAAELAASAEPPQPERAARARALLDQVAAKKR